MLVSLRATVLLFHPPTSPFIPPSYLTGKPPPIGVGGPQFYFTPTEGAVLFFTFRRCLYTGSDQCHPYPLQPWWNALGCRVIAGQGGSTGLFAVHLHFRWGEVSRTLLLSAPFIFNLLSLWRCMHALSVHFFLGPHLILAGGYPLERWIFLSPPSLSFSRDGVSFANFNAAWFDALFRPACFSLAAPKCLSQAFSGFF